MNETVKIPKAMANYIRKSEWFKLYENLEDFVLEAIRNRMENWMVVERT